MMDQIDSKYDFIVNCMGLLIKDSIDRPDRAAWINSWFPHYLEHRLKNNKTKLVHLSTDCVFDGKKGEYLESDATTEINAYGRSKAQGEVVNNKDITFRMSIIGPELKSSGTGLIHWMLTSPQHTLPGWENAWWNGITTLQLAKCVEQYICDPSIVGLYHLVSNKNRINKYELLCKINQFWNLDKNIQRTRALKDVNKILVDSRQEKIFEIPGYDQQLLEMRNFKL
jgi:dTDP-4-dehydrorhamnose reductase